MEHQTVEKVYKLAPSFSYEDQKDMKRFLQSHTTT
jgi:hypothetical protein